MENRIWQQDQDNCMGSRSAEVLNICKEDNLFGKGQGCRVESLHLIEDTAFTLIRISIGFMAKLA